MLTLGVTTSTRRGGVALLSDDVLVALHEYDAPDGHAERLFAAIDACLALAGVDRRAISLFACDVGPGSFTGVRVGVAAIQGAARALGAPVAGVTSLEAMASAARRLGHERVVSVLDAKKSEAFYAVYAPDCVVEPAHVRLADAASLVELERRWGAVSIGELASEIEGLAAVRHPSTDLPGAEHLARVAIGRGPHARGALLEPLYVRAPDAKPAAG